MTLWQWFYIIYAFTLLVDMAVLMSLVMLFRLRPSLLGPTSSRDIPMSKGARDDIRTRMEELCSDVKGQFRPNKALTDGRVIIVVKNTSTAANVTVTPGKDSVRLEVAPRPLHFVSFTMKMLILSFLIGPLAILVVVLSVGWNRRFSADLFNFSKDKLEHSGPGGKKASTGRKKISAPTKKGTGSRKR
jgi:hypothetical protein